MVSANAISQVDSELSGIHLFWIGPYSWIYSPGGWNIQRRKYSGKNKMVCESVLAGQINLLRNRSEIKLGFGWLTWKKGFFYENPSTTISTTVPLNTAAEIFRLDLSVPVTHLRLTIEVKLGFSFALYRGKVVSTVENPRAGNFSIDFFAAAIDTIVTYAFDPVSLQYCIPGTDDKDDKSWDNEPYLVKNLQLPVREINTSLHSTNDEIQLAKSRLLPGEDLDEEGFNYLTNILRQSVKTTYPRQIDKVILVRNDINSKFEELNATAPLVSFFNSPKWRRVMGFEWFDKAGLEPGQSYEYRVTGFFPAQDSADKIYGFHTVPSGTALPVCFFLDDLMLRFSQPSLVELAPGTGISGNMQLSRRGISIKNPDETFWQTPNLHDWSIVLDFQTAVSGIQLELDASHQLLYQTKTTGQALSAITPLPAGNIVKINFSTPIIQLRIKGSGFLFTIRVSQNQNGIVPVSVVTPPVRFVNYPLPSAPSFFSIENLQKIAADQASASAFPTKATRSALGFQLQWRPVFQNGLSYWPPQEQSAPPLESTMYQIEEGQLPTPHWKPLLPEENLISGHRRSDENKSVVSYGVDLMQVFPEAPVEDGATNQNMYWDDVFDFSVDDKPVARPLPKLGTTHQYRIRAVDIIGRPSADWQYSNNADLQKLTAPPSPVGPSLTPADPAVPSIPNGVHTRVLVKQAPDLAATDLIKLGSDNNVITLKWGWHAPQRDLDSYVTEFRIYKMDNALDSIDGKIISVTVVGTGIFECSLQLARPILENAAGRSFLQVDDYPFYIRSHEAGINIKMILERRVPDASGQLTAPSSAAVSVPLLIGSKDMQPSNWKRIATIALGASEIYEFDIRNALNLSALHSKDECWIGVSASDDQPYVQDKLFPLDNRPGNESPIVPVKVQARFWTKPEFVIPPPLGAVDVLIAPEPESGPVHIQLDIATYFEPAQIAGVSWIRPERAAAGAVFASYGVSSDNRLLALAQEKGQNDIEVIVPNPSDKSEIILALKNNDSSGIADRYVVFLAGSHPYRKSFFTPVTTDPVPLSLLSDELLPKSGRYVYRIKSGNEAGLISDGDAMAKLVVKIPSVKAGPSPRRISPVKGQAPNLIKFQVFPDDEITHIVCFYAPSVNRIPGPLQQADLLRVPNLPGLYPDRLLKLRTPEGIFAQQLIVAISSVTADSYGNKIIEFIINGDPGSAWLVWGCSLTSAGIASTLAGPWRIAIDSL